MTCHYVDFVLCVFVIGVRGDKIVPSVVKFWRIVGFRVDFDDEVIGGAERSKVQGSFGNELYV